MGTHGLPYQCDGSILDAVARHVAQALGAYGQAVGRNGHSAQLGHDADEKHLSRGEGGALCRQRHTHPPQVDQAGAGDLPAAGVADGQWALPQQEHRQCGQPADHGGKGRAQRRARNTPAKTEHRDGLAKQLHLPGGIDEEKVEEDVQHADQHADEAGRQGVTRGPQHGGVHPHGHAERQGCGPDAKVGRSIALQRRVRTQPPGQEPADADAQRRHAAAEEDVEDHGLPQHAPGIILAVGPEILRDLDGKRREQPHQNAVEQPGAGADDADGRRGLGPDVAHHGRVNVLHSRDHQLLQDGGHAQGNGNAGRVAQRDALALPHPGRENIK